MRAPAAPWAIALALLGCSDARDERARTPEPPSSGEGAPAGTPSAPPPPAPVVCTAPEIALDDGCVTLPPGLLPQDLLIPGRLGLWNAFSTVAPLAPKAVAKIAGAGIDLAAIGGVAAARPTCDRDGWIAGAGRDRGDERAAVHLAWIVASREVDADGHDALVVLHGGHSERGTLAARNLPRYLPDWVVYDARIATERGGLLFGARPTLGGGFFDGSWR